MILSKRERYIAIAVATALGLFLLDRVLITPLTDRNDLLKRQIEQKGIDRKNGKLLIDRKPSLQTKWNNFVAAGLGNDAAASQKQILDAVQGWATESGLVPSSINPQREEPEQKLQKIVVRATYTGRMESIARFVGRINSSTLPARISDMTISSKKEGTDDLTLQIGISTIFLAPEPDKKPGATGSREERS